METIRYTQKKCDNFTLILSIFCVIAFAFISVSAIIKKEIITKLPFLKIKSEILINWWFIIPLILFILSLILLFTLYKNLMIYKKYYQGNNKQVKEIADIISNSKNINLNQNITYNIEKDNNKFVLTTSKANFSYSQLCNHLNTNPNLNAKYNNTRVEVSFL